MSRRQRRIMPSDRYGPRRRFCPADGKFVPAGEGVTTWMETFCGESCYHVWLHIRGQENHIVPDRPPGANHGGWHRVKKWKTNVIAVVKPRPAHPRRDRRGQGKPTRRA